MIPSSSQFGEVGVDTAPAATAAVSTPASTPSATASHYMANSNYGSSSSASAPKAIDKSKWNTNVKVPQATVDSVKAAGKGNMGLNAGKAAISTGTKYVGSSLAQAQPASPQYKEATNRVYPGAIAKAEKAAKTFSPSDSRNFENNTPYGFNGFNGPNTKRTK